MNEKINLWGLKVRGVQRGKKKGKNHVLQVRKLLFFLVSFSLLLFLCTPKMIFKAWNNVPIKIWLLKMKHIDEDINN
jgi:hypothetical protein